MKFLITGANGTLGKPFTELVEKSGHTAIKWDRTKAPIDNYQGMANYIKEIAPDIIVSMAIASKPTGIENEQWKVNCLWPSEIAKITKELGIKFLYTSTVMVFSFRKSGPFTIESKPDTIEGEGYGYEKRMAEENVIKNNPDACIVRLGWQIGDKPGSNNMVDYCVDKMKNEKIIRASSNYFPACSFIENTLSKLFSLSADFQAGIFMIDSNKKWSLNKIIKALKKHLGINWKIGNDPFFKYDQRMIDPQVEMPPLSDKLKDIDSFFL